MSVAAVNDHRRTELTINADEAKIHAPTKSEQFSEPKKNRDGVDVEIV